MQLKTEQMVELLIALGSPAQPPPPTPWGGSERRCEPRVGIGYPTRIRLLAGLSGRTADPEPATLRDVSSRGVGIAFRREMDVGESFVVELPRLGGDTFEVLCLVANCHAIADSGDDRFHIGARFLAPWREDDRDEGGKSSRPATVTAAA